MGAVQVRTSQVQRFLTAAFKKFKARPKPNG
jgi:hypothetical protein